MYKHKLFSNNILNSISDAVTIHDKDFNIVYFNAAARKLLNLKDGETVKCYKAFHGFDAPPESCPSYICWQTGQSCEISISEPFLMRHLDISVYPQLDESGQMTSVVHIARDVTIRKQNEILIADRERRFRELTEGLPEIVFETDINGKFTYVNRFAYETMGYTEDDLERGVNCIDIVVPEDRQRMAENFERVVNGEVLGDTEYRVCRKSGQTLDVIVRSSILLKDGERQGLRGVVIDITARKDAELKLKKNEALLNAVIDNAPVCVKMLNRKGCLLMMNRAGLDMIDADSFDQVRGQCVYPLITPEFRQKFIDLTEKCFEGSSGSLVFETIGLKGRSVWLETHAVPFRNENDKILALLGVTLDVTERKVAEEALAVRTAQLETALSQKDMLIRETYHRVKNNLAVIQSLLTLQMRDIKDERDKTYFRDVQGRIKSMAMIHERLHHSEDLKSIDIGEYIESLSNMLMQNYTTNRNISLRCDLQGLRLDVDLMIPLGLIVNELVSNALKHAFPDGRDGEIQISLNKSGKNEYELAVRDNGVGLSEGFDLNQLESLGMTIVTSLARQLGGELTITGAAGVEVRIRFKDISQENR